MIASKIAYSARNSAGRILYPILGKGPACPHAVIFSFLPMYPYTTKRGESEGGESSLHQNKNTFPINLKCFLYDYLRLIYPWQVF